MSSPGTVPVARASLAAFTREESVSTSIVTLRGTRVADGWRCRSNKRFSRFWFWQVPSLRARVRLLFLLADGACWHVGSSPVFRLKHGALHFCSGGDAPASPCASHRSPRFNSAAATSSLNHPAGCAASTRGSPLDRRSPFLDYSSGCCAVSAPDRAWLPRSTDGVGTPLSSVPHPEVPL